MNYYIKVKTKSLGLAIVLTLLFGPLGLLYATIRGGLIMILTPLILFLFLIIGLANQSVGLFASSAILLVVFSISYWIICVVWAATAVSNYNNKVLNDAREAEFLRTIKDNSNRDYQNNTPKVEINTQDKQNNDSSIITFKEWIKVNPYCSISDYYKIYGVPKSSNTTLNQELAESTIKEENYTFHFIVFLGIVIILITLGVLSFDKRTKSFNLSKLTNSIGLNSDNKEIELQIENVYFGLINGAYTSQSLSGITPQDLPFYNSNLSTLVVMGFAPLAMLSGNVSLEPRNIEIQNIYDNNADVTYDLYVINENREKVIPINMTLKKIGGKWKLDAQKFLPFDDDKKSKKKKYKY